MKKYSSKKLLPWPEFGEGDLLKINTLTTIKYKSKTQKLYYEDEYVPEGFDQWWRKGFIDSWWMKPGLDPWSNKPFWGEQYEQPTHHFNRNVDDNLRWMCGYSFVVEVPEEYDPAKKYPLVIYLHGSVDAKTEYFVSRDKTRTLYFRPKDDPYIFAAPIRLDIDWNSKKLVHMIENIKDNLNVDENRIYLSGLSMGGRGTFIVAADKPNLFAAIMPLSPHHGPYSYLSLAKKVKHLPIWMSHGNKDKISSYELAKQMADTLTYMGANIKFRTEKNVGHWGWDSIFKDSIAMSWLLSWKKK